MEFKYIFALILIVTILFSLGNAVASEDINHNPNSSDVYIGTSDNQCPVSDDAEGNVAVSIGSHLSEGLENPNPIGDGLSDSSSNGDINLSVDMEIGDTVKHAGAIGEVFFDVPFIITANVNNGTVHNVKICISMPGEFKYVSHEKTIGTYDPETGIWEIGDLSSNVNATLTIMTNLTKKDFYVITVNTTADSNDTNITVNDLECTINATNKISSGISRTSRSIGAVHNGPPPHRDPNPGPVEPNPNPGPVEPNPNPGPVEPNPNPDPEPVEPTPEPIEPVPNPDPEPVEPTPEPAVTKSIESFTSSISAGLASLLGLNSSDSDINLSDDVVKAITAQDYAKIPILIFAVFLIAILAIVGYDKFKS